MVTSKFVGIEQAGVLSLALTVGNQLMTIGFFNIRAFQISDVTEKYKFSDYCVFRVFTVGAMLLAGVNWVAQGAYTNEKTAAIAILVLFRGAEAVSDLLEAKELRITPAGSLLLKSAREIISIEQNLKQNMKTMNRIRPLRVGATVTVGANIIGKIIEIGRAHV